MRAFLVSAGIAMACTSPAAAQSYATYDQPSGATTSISSGERITFSYPAAPLPASVVEVDEVQSVPIYESYEPLEFDASAYELATEPLLAPLTNPVILDDVSLTAPIQAPIDVTPRAEDYSLPLGASETFAPTEQNAPLGELGFQSETETSRLLLALEDTHAKRVADLKARNLTQRKTMLDQFEKDAADPSKVIGLAARMRTALAELDAAHKALLSVEEQQFMAATLKVLDAAPSRAE